MGAIRWSICCTVAYTLSARSVQPERYATPEVVLADPETAPNLAVDSVILDPTGRLSELQTGRGP